MGQFLASSSSRDCERLFRLAWRSGLEESPVGVVADTKELGAAAPLGNLFDRLELRPGGGRGHNE
jgi:hypothetical protein